MRRSTSLIIVLVGTIPGLTRAQNPVYFADSNLKAAFEDALGISDPTPTDMLSLTGLDVWEYGVTDLTGIEYATNLEWLDLACNNVSNISALSGLTNLSELYLEENLIVDILPLSQLTNLDELLLSNNRIRNISALSGLKVLFSLDLGYNQISDVSALSGLVDLGYLSLNNNLISDISYISHLDGLLYLDIRSNPLNEDAYSIHIPRLTENNFGIELYADQWTEAQLIVSSNNGGSVTMPGEGAFDYIPGEIVTIQATASHGYSFVCWTGTAVDAGKVAEPATASTTVVVDGRYTLQAEFQTPEGLVYFPDPNLRACVEHALEISNPKPEDMLLLTRLDSKDLPGHVITDLTGLEHATNLTELWLYGNRIIDIYALSSLTELAMLDLGRNKIDDISALAGLVKLTDLYLDDNWIYDLSPLSGLKNLQGLELSVNGIDDLEPLSNLKNLEWLGLEENEISDISPLSELVNLAELYLALNYLEDISPLAGLTNLVILDLSCNDMELDLSPLAGLTNLVELDIEQSMIYDISALSGLTNLVYLNLRINDIWDISPLSQLHNLEWLNLEWNAVDDISALSGLAALQWLNLKRNIITNIYELSELRSLEWIDLSYNEIEDVSALLDLKHLNTVILWGNSLTDEACRQVQELIDRGVIVRCECDMQVFSLTISSSNGGKVTIPGQGLFTQIPYGTVKEIEATPDPGYYFVNWTGTAVDADKVYNPKSAFTAIVVDANYTIMANFVLEEINRSEKQIVYDTSNFLIYYYTGGKNAVDLLDEDATNVPNFVEEVGKAFEDANSYLVDTLGFECPSYPTYSVLYPDKYQIYIEDLGDKLGETRHYPFVDYTYIYINSRLSTTNPPASSYVISGNKIDLGLINCVAAHEFFHAIQFRTVGWFMMDSLAISKKLWIPEGSAEWAGYKTFLNYYSPTDYPHAENEFTNTAIVGFLGQTDRSLFESDYSAGLYWYYIDQKFGTSTINEIWSFFAALGSPLFDSGAEYAIDRVLAERDYDFEKSFKDFSKENYFWEVYNHVQVGLPFILNVAQLPYSNIHHLPERATCYFKIIASDVDNVRLHIKDPGYDSNFFVRAYPNENSQDEFIIPINKPIEIAGNETVIIIDRFAGLNPLAEDAFEINIATDDQDN